MNSDIEDGELLSSDDEVETEEKCDIKEVIKTESVDIPLKSEDNTDEHCKLKRKNGFNISDGEVVIKRKCIENVTKDKKRYLCKYYAAGECKNRNVCQFMHEDFPCKFFHDSTMICRSGENCKYSHAPLSDEMKEIVEAFKNDKSKERISPPKDDSQLNRVRCLLPNPTNLSNNQNHSDNSVNINSSAKNEINLSQLSRNNQTVNKSRFSDVTPNRITTNKPLSFILPTKPGQPIVRPDFTQPPPTLPIDKPCTRFTQSNPISPEIEAKLQTPEFLETLMRLEKKVLEYNPNIQRKFFNYFKRLADETANFNFNGTSQSMLWRTVNVPIHDDSEEHFPWKLRALDESILIKTNDLYKNMNLTKNMNEYYDPRFKELKYEKCRINLRTYNLAPIDAVDNDEYVIVYNLLGQKLLKPRKHCVD